MGSSFTEHIVLRPGRREDADSIRTLYTTVARESGWLAREPDEVTAAYVAAFVERSLADGVLLVAELAGLPGLAAELHTYRNGLRRFAHVLSHLTVAVHPQAQGRGIGRRLFETLLEDVRANRPEIARVELIVQESNQRALKLYESLGFRRNGRLENGIRSSSGALESDIPMGWLR